MKGFNLIEKDGASLPTLMTSESDITIAPPDDSGSDRDIGGGTGGAGWAAAPPL